MFRFAIVREETMTVESVALWDGTSVWAIPPQRLTYMLSDDSQVAVGWKVDTITNTFFIPTFHPEEGIMRIEKIDFMRLFTMPERIMYNTVRSQVTNLTLEDRLDPNKQLLLMAEIMFEQFDLAAKIELSHPETQGGIDLLGMLGVFGTDPAVIASRKAQILEGLSPSGEVVAT